MPINTSIVAMGIALLIGISFIIIMAGLSFASGVIHHIFNRPEFLLLRSLKGEQGFAAYFKGDSANDQVRFDSVRIKCFNPFAQPSQVIIERSIEMQVQNCLVDIDMGIKYKILNDIMDKHESSSRILVEFKSSKDGIVRAKEYRSCQFKKSLMKAVQTIDHFKEKNKNEEGVKPLFTLPKRSFINEPKVLKIASNPRHAGEFVEIEDRKNSSLDNFAISKVWIEEGCIVCDACSDIYKEVFNVKDSGCEVIVGSPMDNGLLIQEAAEACPVEIIKFLKISG